MNSQFHTSDGNNPTPAYIRLYEEGILEDRVDQAFEYLYKCSLCPHICSTNRAIGEQGRCRSARYAVVGDYFIGHDEETCISGDKGSGLIVFSGCNMRCVFCNISSYSHLGEGQQAYPEELAGMMLELQEKGCHNLNLVTPSHVIPQILEALLIAIKKGLSLPLIYNTSSYDSRRSLRFMDGIVDIYLPDFKIWNEEFSQQFLKVNNYAEVARRSLLEMHHQVGTLRLDDQDIAIRGALFRHLLMPGAIAGTEDILRFIASEISTDSYLHLMQDYLPTGELGSSVYESIASEISLEEFDEAISLAKSLGFWRIDTSRTRNKI